MMNKIGIKNIIQFIVEKMVNDTITKICGKYLSRLWLRSYKTYVAGYLIATRLQIIQKVQDILLTVIFK